jgi:molybdenum cofactor guanylyltransferase
VTFGRPDRAAVDAIVLSGGSSRRLGRPKTIEPLGGRLLLRRVTDALADVRGLVIVGPADGAGRADRVVREDPPGGGPVAALRAGVVEVAADYVITLAGDLPFVTSAAIGTLLDGLVSGSDVAVARDDRGRDQYLVAAWRTDQLRGALAAVEGPSPRLGAVFATAQVTSVDLPGLPPVWWDCDTEADLVQARRWLSSQSERLS